MTPAGFDRAVNRIVRTASRKCRPHDWRDPADGKLMCRRCGRTIILSELEYWRRNSIARAITARRGHVAGARFQRALSEAIRRDE